MSGSKVSKILDISKELEDFQNVCWDLEQSSKCQHNLSAVKINKNIVRAQTLPNFPCASALSYAKVNVIKEFEEHTLFDMPDLVYAAIPAPIPYEIAGEPRSQPISAYPAMNLTFMRNYCQSSKPEGTFGQIFKAFCKTKNTDVAIKQVEMKNGYCSEKELMEQLKHSSIMEIFDGFQLDRWSYLVMELADFNLQELQRRHSIDFNMMVHISKSVLEGLVYMHSKGIVHLNIKPKNIFFVNGNVKIGNFNDASTFPVPLGARGSTFYMAPEIIQDMDFCKFSNKCDSWCFGITGIELLDGKLPYYNEFHGKSVFFRLHVCSPTYQAPRLQAKNTAWQCEKFGEIVKSALQVDPGKRSSADQLLAMVNKLDENRKEHAVRMKEIRRQRAEVLAEMERSQSVLAILRKMEVNLREMSKS